MTPTEFATALKSERHRLGIRQTDAAKICEVHLRTIAAWELADIRTIKPPLMEGVLARLNKAKPSKRPVTITGKGYDSSKTLLALRFSDGRDIRYPNVSQAEYDALCAAKDITAHFRACLEPVKEGRVVK